MLAAEGIGMTGTLQYRLKDSREKAFIIGPRGNTICSKCGYKRQHIHGAASKLRSCPKCGSYMTYHPDI